MLSFEALFNGSSPKSRLDLGSKLGDDLLKSASNGRSQMMVRPSNIFVWEHDIITKKTEVIVVNL